MNSAVSKVLEVFVSPYNREECPIDSLKSILIFINRINTIQLETVIITVFGVSVLLILTSAIFTVIEISKSLHGLNIEIETVTRNYRAS